MRHPHRNHLHFISRTFRIHDVRVPSHHQPRPNPQRETLRQLIGHSLRRHQTHLPGLPHPLQQRTRPSKGLRRHLKGLRHHRPRGQPRQQPGNAPVRSRPLRHRNRRRSRIRRRQAPVPHKSPQHIQRRLIIRRILPDPQQAADSPHIRRHRPQPSHRRAPRRQQRPSQHAMHARQIPSRPSLVHPLTQPAHLLRTQRPPPRLASPQRKHRHVPTLHSRQSPRLRDSIQPPLEHQRRQHMMFRQIHRHHHRLARIPRRQRRRLPRRHFLRRRPVPRHISHLRHRQPRHRHQPGQLPTPHLVRVRRRHSVNTLPHHRRQRR